jgi:hypothetical protein
MKRSLLIVVIFFASLAANTSEFVIDYNNKDKAF